MNISADNIRNRTASDQLNINKQKFKDQSKQILSKLGSGSPILDKSTRMNVTTTDEKYYNPEGYSNRYSKNYYSCYPRERYPSSESAPKQYSLPKEYSNPVMPNVVNQFGLQRQESPQFVERRLTPTKLRVTSIGSNSVIREESKQVLPSQLEKVSILPRLDPADIKFTSINTHQSELSQRTVKSISSDQPHSKLKISSRKRLSPPKPQIPKASSQIPAPKPPAAPQPATGDAFCSYQNHFIQGT